MNTIEPYKQAHESSLEQFVSHCRISYRSIHNNPRYVNAVVALADQLDDCRDARSRRDVEAANLEQRLGEAMAFLVEGTRFPMLTGERADWLIRVRNWLGPERATSTADASTNSPEVKCDLRARLAEAGKRGEAALSEEMYRSMFQETIRALAAIDAALGMPDDGCNSPERTITAIKMLLSAHEDDVAEIERLRSRLADLEAERALIIQRAENAEAALVETQAKLDARRNIDRYVSFALSGDENVNPQDAADVVMSRLAAANALLREESHEHYRFTQMTEYPAVTRMLLWHMDRKRRIDAHLAREEKP